MTSISTYQYALCAFCCMMRVLHISYNWLICIDLLSYFCYLITGIEGIAIGNVNTGIEMIKSENAGIRVGSGKLTSTPAEVNTIYYRDGSIDGGKSYEIFMGSQYWKCGAMWWEVKYCMYISSQCVTADRPAALDKNRLGDRYSECSE